MATSEEREEVKYFYYFIIYVVLLNTLSKLVCLFLQVIAKDIPEVVALLTDLNDQVYLNHFYKVRKKLR